MQTIYDTEAENQIKRTNKKCPFCAEIIQYEAIKCRYCGEFLDGRQQNVVPQPPSTNKPKVLHSTGALVMALLTVGPFAIPLIWTNPRYSKTVKTLLTIGILGVTVALCWGIYYVMTDTMRQLKSLGIGI